MGENAIVGIAWLLLALSAAGCAYLAISAWAVRRFAARRTCASHEQRPTTVLKPLCGTDADLFANLRSFCCQNHNETQTVCGVRDDHDPAIAVVRRLIAELPGADITLVVDHRVRGRNLKVANLHNMLPAARHPTLVIADSDMRVRPDYLSTVTAPLGDPAVGLVTCLYRGIPADDSLWSRLACLHVNHGFLPQAAVADAIGAQAGCFGASMALRRETLDGIGGFAAIEDTLADDYELGAAVRRLGFRVELSSELVDNIIVESSFLALFRHELRWARTIRLVAPAGFAGLAVTQPVIMAALALALGVMPIQAAGMLVVALLSRYMCAVVVDRALGLRSSPLHLLPIRDGLSFAVFVASFFARRVAWRDQTFRVGRNGQMTLDGDSLA